jgi:hypothetical protein
MPTKAAALYEVACYFNRVGLVRSGAKEVRTIPFLATRSTFWKQNEKPRCCTSWLKKKIIVDK